MGQAFTLHHSPRSGKTLLALLALLGKNLPIKWKLLAHQEAAKKAMEDAGMMEESVHLGMMVFSSLIVLSQFVKEYISDVSGVDILIVCSAEEITKGLEALEKVTETDELARKLKEEHKRPVLILTSYQSVHKIDETLKAEELKLDMAVFDEAHNVHTPTRWFLYGGTEESPVPCEEGLELLGKRYPRRLYLTGTPRKEMSEFPQVYGNKETNWHRYSYAQLLREQERKVVKPFDVKVVLNGKPSDRKEDPEFFDCLAILREIANGNDEIKRVKVYHKRAKRVLDDSEDSGEESEHEDEEEENIEEEKRSAEFFGGNTELWQEALDYLHTKGEAATLKFQDLELYYVHGGLKQNQIKESLEKFNSEDDKIHILCSCQIFKEGVTLQKCDLTVFADGKRSKRDIVQSGMRGLKFDSSRPGARLGILLLVNLDGIRLQENSPTSATISDCIKNTLHERDKMETVASVLEALKEENEELAEAIMEAASPRKNDSKHGGESECVCEDMRGKSQKPGKKTSFVVSLAEEFLLQWSLHAEDIKEIEKEVTGSIRIRLANVALNRNEILSHKVDWFCKLWADRKPTRNETKEVPNDWLPVNTELEARPIGGQFWHNIQPNFVGNGTEAPTTLDEASRAKVRLLPWFPEAKAALETSRTENAKFYKASTTEQVEWFCKLWADRKPKRHETKEVPKDWLPANTELDARPIGGLFWKRIQENFFGDGTGAKTSLDEASRAKVRLLPWFPEAKAALETSRTENAKFYKASTTEQVEWFCKLWADRKPKINDTKRIPKEWLPANTELDARPIGGPFWNNIQRNFVEEGTGANTSLDEASRAKVRLLPWFPEAKAALETSRTENAKFYKASTTEQVEWFCKLWADQKPKKKDRKRIPKEWLPVNTELEARPIGGHFWNNIQRNFVGDGTRAQTTLDETDRIKVRALSWFPEAKAALETFQAENAKFYKASTTEQVEWFCKLWADRTPKRNETKEVPNDWLPVNTELDVRPIGGQIWHKIKRNFVGDGTGAHTTLNEADRAKIRALSWFPSAHTKMLEYRKNKSAREETGASTQETKKKTLPRSEKQKESPKQEIWPASTKQGTMDNPSSPQEGNHKRKKPLVSSPKSTKKRKTVDHRDSEVEASDLEDSTTASSSSGFGDVSRLASEHSPVEGTPDGESISIGENTPKRKLETTNTNTIKKTKIDKICEDLDHGSINIDSRGRPDLEGERKLLSKGYDAATFTKAHHAWKERNIQEILDEIIPKDRILYLDHWVTDAQEGRLRTTDTFLKDGVKPENCFCANPNKAIVSALAAKSVNNFEGYFADALKSVWKHQAFEVVYADFCYASDEKIIKDLEILLQRKVKPPRFLVWTMTGRAEKSMLERFTDVHSFLERRAYQAFGYLDESRSYFKPSSVVTCYFKKI